MQVFYMCFSVKGKLEPFLSVAGQTLESFVKSLDEEEKPQQQNYNCHEHQFVLALAGVITSKDYDSLFSVIFMCSIESRLFALNVD